MLNLYLHDGVLAETGMRFAAGPVRFPRSVEARFLQAPIP